MTDTPLSTRALNRALLARQMLLAREPLPAATAIERLVGMQAQDAAPPFAGLWSRLEGFRRDSLLGLLHDRSVVRATMMRATIHLVTAGDYLSFRSTLQPMLTLGGQAILKSRQSDFDLPKVLAEAERFFKRAPQTFEEVRTHLSARFPDVDERAMGYAARMEIPLVMVPDDSEYGFTGARFFSAEKWLHCPIAPDNRIEDLLLRYLAAFGPASVRDAQAWSAIPKLTPVFERLRPRLLVFRDERKREMFDLPEAPRPPEDTPAPVRFIPAFDNILLAHDGRTRIIADEHRPRVSLKNLRILPTFLVDGFVAGTWEIVLRKKMATLTATPFHPLTLAIRKQLIAEAGSLLRFTAPETPDIAVQFEEA